jgi:hypothetical protein
VFGDEVGVLAQAVAGALDLDDDGVVQEAIEERRGDDGIAEHFTPLREAAVGGEDHRAFLVAGVDQLEEQVGAAGGDRQVADLVDDEQARPGEEADLVAEAAVAFGAAERLDELGQRAAVDALAGLDRGDAETDGEVAFAGAGRTRRILPDIAAAKRRSITRFTRAKANASSSCAATVGVA